MSPPRDEGMALTACLPRIPLIPLRFLQSVWHGVTTWGLALPLPRRPSFSDPCLTVAPGACRPHSSLHSICSFLTDLTHG